MSFRDRYEPFIAWRYLYRPRRNKMVRALTWWLLALTLVTHAAALLGHAPLQVVGTALALPSLLSFLFCLLLNFLSGFTTVSIIGVTIGVQALMVVLAVTSGFQQAFKQKVLGVNAHVIVMKYGLDFSEYRDVIKKAEQLPHVKAAAPFVFIEAMVAADKSFGAMIKGIDPVRSQQVLDVKQSLVSGHVEDLARRAPANDGGDPLPSALMGKELAKKLHLKVGDRVRLVSPKTDLDPSAGQLASREFRLGGIFYTGFQEYDSRLVYINVSDAQAYTGSGDVVTGVELKLDDVDAAQALAKRLYNELGGSPYHVIDWEELNHNLFTALRLQKVVIAVVLALIVVVAAFNIVAAMTLLVIGKTKEIAILKSMGMRSAGVARLFQTAGLAIGGLGIACGLGVGGATVAVLRRYNYQLDPHVYLIDQLPVRVNLDEVLLTAAITLAICFVASLVPALQAARLTPVEGLRYE
ncbi:MAG TPA: ABC transporter permease [Polyangia bacterium]|nr:ABC transporter permease [Polyangia bacterium]